VAPLALAALLAGCFGHGQRSETEDESESFWSTEAEAPASAPAPEYEVQRGDTLIMIAFRRGLDWRELASLNHLGTPYTIYPGQRLKLPVQPLPPVQPVASATSADATVAEPPVPSAEGTGTETYAVHESGAAQVATPSATQRPPDAAHAKATRESAPAEDTEGGSLTRAIRGNSSASATKTESPAESAAKDGGATPLAAPTNKATEPASKPSDAAGKPVVVASAAPPAAPASPPTPVVAAGPARSVAGASWRWPAQGTLVGRYLPGDPARQGINVQGKPGAIVSAAADGEVVYSGNGLVGYGELIIVKHNGELLSAYGGSGKRLVAEGAKVRSGQPLAELAGNGIVHFEIRRSGKPVDPLEYLPGR
jgi:lipoprotein NlpD